MTIVKSFTSLAPQTILLMKRRCNLLVIRGLVSIKLLSCESIFNWIIEDTDPADVVKRECLSWLLCTYSNHGGQRATSHFPETPLLFLFLCGGMRVKMKKRVITPSWVFLDIRLWQKSIFTSFWSKPQTSTPATPELEIHIFAHSSGQEESKPQARC